MRQSRDQQGNAQDDLLPFVAFYEIVSFSITIAQLGDEYCGLINTHLQLKRLEPTIFDAYHTILVLLITKRFDRYKRL